jgi:hypothetical protein
MASRLDQKGRRRNTEEGISKITSNTREGKERKEEKKKEDKQLKKATAGINKEPKARGINPSRSQEQRKKEKGKRNGRMSLRCSEITSGLARDLTLILVKVERV